MISQVKINKHFQCTIVNIFLPINFNIINIIEPRHEISNNVVCATSEASDLSICLSLEYSRSVKLLTEHHLQFLSLKGGCTG